MKVNLLDGNTFAQMVLAGANHLTNNASMIDALNVFPVPDGDTGTNMNLSMTSGANEVKTANPDQVTDVAQALAKGLLMGARGNSGVILSQLFRGFAKGVEGKKKLTTKDFAHGLDVGVNTAYKAVIKPVEGTILTVAKDTAKKAVELAGNTDDMITFMEGVLDASKVSLKRTPDLLPVLKEVGVVDSGGQGLVTIYEGFLASLKGEELPESSESSVDMKDMVSAEHHKLAQDFMNTEDIEFGYCTEIMVKFEEDKLKKHPYDEESFRNELSEFGDSLLVVSDDEIVKVHVHVENPGEVLNLGQRFGSFINIKVENMREQHTSIVGDKEKKTKTPKEKTDYAVVSVAMGEGLKELLESLGATVVIQGGQTMNPSTQDITDAINEANAHNIVVLPNNKNIIMAAEQAAELSDDNVVVVPTKTIPQGMSALLAFHPQAKLEENKQNMIEASQQVKTGQVTYAVRDTQIDGMTIKNGNFMGLADGKIKVNDKDKLKVIKDLLSDMITDEDEIITILQGEEASDEEVKQIESFIEENFEDIELEVHKGNQPIYSYIFSIE
ncbi:DAK2 domain-containing protein [Aquibacillus koreensis]|uniref:DAK2 domain-containing protein n=1 Tax=Aquibacillus koreensis TaxID=279446 RepID=A0A9X4AHW5_9BACI|nr:DAK2 domain-containing protein [Aquibacillus koreensis]MCT2538009.1 DAK2 domain-containing protein [Aquibacillus koreensis]MDC3420532.1 DAK2 domain-containing protein [Aquibacillus koreensis]